MEKTATPATTANTATPAAPGTTKPTLAKRPAGAPAPKATAPKTAPSTAAAPKAAAPKATVKTETKEPKTPSRTIKGSAFTAVKIYSMGQADEVLRVSRALREIDVKAAMRKSKRKNQIRLFVLDRHLATNKAKIQGLIDNPPKAEAPSA